MHAAQAQQAAAHQQAQAAMAAAGMHPGMMGAMGGPMGAAGLMGSTSASDMMRRLQQEGGTAGGFRNPS